MWDGILNACAAGLHNLALLVGDWGLAIIIVTLVIRFALFPLQRKQLKSSFNMQQMQPRIQEIQQLYAGDQQRIQEETMKIYQETNFNPVAGCLPLIVQMPVFVILFQVLRWKIQNFQGEELAVAFYNILPDLTITATQAYEISLSYAITYIVFAILFVIFSVSPMVLQLKQNPQNKSQTYMMLVIMGVMFIWMAYISPAGVLLYWALSSAFGFCQSLITNKQLRKKREEEEAAKPIVQPVKVNVERKGKKKRPTKKR